MKRDPAETFLDFQEKINTRRNELLFKVIKIKTEADLLNYYQQYILNPFCMILLQCGAFK